jgi:phage terminase large subunit-like protein
VNTWDQYAQDVISGAQVACRWVRLACQRHVNDLVNGPARGLWFDEAAANHAIKFFGFLRHSKGEWAGRVMTLEAWQQFIIAMVFGWMRADNTRRFRVAYIEVARKNGKSTLAAGVGLDLLVADGEPGAEIYTAATKRDQARITHSEATRMVKSSPSLRKRIRVFRDNLNIENTASKMEPLGADSDTLDGLNPHGALVDEVHAHKTRDLWDVLETATGARRQPLIFATTTAGFNRQSLCYQLHDYTEKVLSGVLQNDSHFGMIYTLDLEEGKGGKLGDDWEDESVWVKANPNLGVSKKLSTMREKAEKARGMPAALNAFLRLELNVWTQSETKWISREHWDACGAAVDANGLRGRRCFAGLDLSSNVDITAELLVFPPESTKDPYRVLCRFWIPEDAIDVRSKRDRVPYDAWVRAGYIATTPGNVIDHDFILAQIEQDAEAYDIQQLAFDSWGASQVQTKLAEIGGREDWIVKFGQGFASMSPAMRDLERLILGHRLAHGNNPVLTWMADNLVVDTDAAANIKPDKEHSIERIDGMVALIMAVATAMRGGGKPESVYEKRGIRQL